MRWNFSTNILVLPTLCMVKGLMMVGQVGELLRRVRNGDSAAVRILVEGSWDSVCRYTMRLGASAGEAEDLAQEVFIKAFRSIDSFTRGTNFRAWLLKIATNCFIDNARRKASRPEAAAGEHGLAAPVQENPDATAQLQELERAVRSALQALPEAQRAAFILRVYEGLPHREIAGVVGKSEPTLRWHLHQARKKLQEMLSDFL